MGEGDRREVPQDIVVDVVVSVPTVVCVTNGNFNSITSHQPRETSSEQKQKHLIVLIFTTTVSEDQVSLCRRIQESGVHLVDNGICLNLTWILCDNFVHHATVLF